MWEVSLCTLPNGGFDRLRALLTVITLCSRPVPSQLGPPLPPQRAFQGDAFAASRWPLTNGHRDAFLASQRPFANGRRDGFVGSPAVGGSAWAFGPVWALFGFRLASVGGFWYGGEIDVMMDRLSCVLARPGQVTSSIRGIQELHV
jgi:hypothetical protein